MTNTVNILYRETTTPNLPSVSSAKQAPLTNREIDGNFKSIANAIETIGTNVNQVQNWIKVEGSYEPDPNTAYYNKPVSNFTGVIQHNGNELLNTQNWVTHLTSGSEKVLTTSNWGTHLKHGSEVVLTSGNWHSHVSNNFMMGGQHSFSSHELRRMYVKSAMEYCANLVAPGITPNESLLTIYTRILARQIPDESVDLNNCSIYFDNLSEGDQVAFKNYLMVFSHTIVPDEHKLESNQVDVFFTDKKLSDAISHAQQFLYGECAAASSSINGVLLTSENWHQYIELPQQTSEKYFTIREIWVVFKAIDNLIGPHRTTIDSIGDYDESTGTWSNYYCDLNYDNLHRKLDLMKGIKVDPTTGDVSYLIDEDDWKEKLVEAAYYLTPPDYRPSGSPVVDGAYSSNDVNAAISQAISDINTQSALQYFSNASSVQFSEKSWIFFHYFITYLVGENCDAKVSITSMSFEFINNLVIADDCSVYFQGGYNKHSWMQGAAKVPYFHLRHHLGLTGGGDIGVNGTWTQAEADAAFDYALNYVQANCSSFDYNVHFGTMYTMNISSDQRLKTNIEPLQNSLDNVVSLEGVSFDWKENGEPSIGVIAQQIEPFYPQLVSEDGNGMKSVNYSGLVGVLIEAMKEQQGMINELRSEVEKLKG